MRIWSHDNKPHCHKRIRSRIRIWLGTVRLHTRGSPTAALAARRKPSQSGYPYDSDSDRHGCAVHAGDDRPHRFDFVSGAGEANR